MGAAFSLYANELLRPLTNTSYVQPAHVVCGALLCLRLGNTISTSTGNQ